MFFRRQRASVDPVQGRWRQLAERLELDDAGDVSERIRRWLDLDDAELDPVFLLQRPGLPAVYLYDAHTARRGPSGTMRRTKRCCLVRSEEPISAVAFRAMPRQNKAVEAIEAGRSGGERVAVVGDPAFDGSVSVFARQPAEALAVLATPVREVLRRVLVVRGAREPRLVVGERHLVATFDVDGSETDLITLEHVLADTLSLVALLPGPPRVRISPDDLLDLG